MPIDHFGKTSVTQQGGANALASMADAQELADLLLHLSPDELDYVESLIHMESPAPSNDNY